MAKFCILALVAFIIVLAVGPVLVSCQAAKPSANIVDATVASVATAVSNNNWNILSKIFTQFRSARMISLKEKRDANFVRVCETGSIQKIDGFIKASYSIDVADKDEGSTCLMKATAKDRHNIVAHLLQKGGKKFMHVSSGLPPSLHSPPTSIFQKHLSLNSTPRERMCCSWA